MFEGTFILNSNLTEEDWDKLADVDMENTPRITFRTPSGKEVVYVKESQPCNNCISREAVNTLIDELARAISDERSFVSRGRATSTIMQDILELPSVTPKQKVGKWIDMKYKDEWWCPVGKCLNCGKEHILGSNYCPNCGADMKGEAE